MANTELLLVKPVEGLGHEGERVKVKAGYARNFLLPKKIAVPVTRANRKQIESLQTKRQKRLEQELKIAQEIAAKLAAVRVAIAVKTGPEGRVFGSVTAQQLQERLAAEGLSLERKQIGLYNPAKTLGKHTTRVKLHPDLTVDFEFEVVSENPIAAPKEEPKKEAKAEEKK